MIERVGKRENKRGRRERERKRGVWQMFGGGLGSCMEGWRGYASGFLILFEIGILKGSLFNFKKIK